MRMGMGMEVVEWREIFLPVQKQFFRRFEWAGQRRRADTRLPFRTQAHLVPTNQPLCCSPERKHYLKSGQQNQWSVKASPMELIRYNSVLCTSIKPFSLSGQAKIFLLECNSAYHIMPYSTHSYRWSLSSSNLVYIRSFFLTKNFP